MKTHAREPATARALLEEPSSDPGATGPTPGPANPVPLAGISSTSFSHAHAEGWDAEPVQVGSGHDAAEAHADRLASEALSRLRPQSAGSEVSQTTHMAPLDTLRRWPTPTAGAELGEAGGPLGAESERILHGTRGRGVPIPGPIRGRMEPAFRASLSDVRVHTGTDAAELSRRMSAEAFTHGHDIYFRRGMPDVMDQGDMHVLAHEIAHSIQAGRDGRLRRFLVINGKKYKEGDEAEVRALGKIPDGWQEYLKSQSSYYLMGDKWSADFQLSLKNVSKDHAGRTPKELKISSSDPLNAPTVVRPDPHSEKEVPADPSKRFLPKPGSKRTVAKIRLLKVATNLVEGEDLENEEKLNTVHWMIECSASVGDKSAKIVKIHLTNLNYEILYQAARVPESDIRKPGEKAAQGLQTGRLKYDPPVELVLEQPLPVLEVYKAAIDVARAHGPWTRGVFTCQDYALALLQTFNMDEGSAKTRGELQETRDSYKKGLI